MVFHFGTCRAQKPKMSVISRREGRGGKRYVPRAMYSLRMSFCTVPERDSHATPCRRATASTIASNVQAVALIVMETETRWSGIPASSVSMSPRVSYGHTDLAYLAESHRIVRVVTDLSREIERDRQPGLTLL